MRAHHPNVVFFTWHDAGDWFGCYGHGTVSTPGVDRLAGEGVRFTNCFSACAICSPSRAALMTGRHPQQTGLMRLANTVFDDRIHPHVPHLAKRLKVAGYHTALFGVQHEAAHEHVFSIQDYDEMFATDPWPRAEVTARIAGQWIRGRADDSQPFFMQVGSFEAHLGRFYSGQPCKDTEPYPPVQDISKGLSIPGYLAGTPADHASVATVQGLLARGDGILRSILDALDESDLAGNTLVVMCVDHGVGLSRAKATCYDPGHRVAWLMRWPGVLPANHEVSELCSHVDVLPTLRDLTGWEIHDPLDGFSFAGHAKANAEGEIRDAVFGHMTDTRRMIRTQTHKLIRNFRPSPMHRLRGNCAEHHAGFPKPGWPVAQPDQIPDDTFPMVELYDLRKDPFEMHNLAVSEHPTSTQRDLNARLWDFLMDQDDFLLHESVKTPWQQWTRRALEDHCAQGQRTPSRACGPLLDRFDALTALGGMDESLLK